MYVNEAGELFATHADIRKSLKQVSLPAVLTDEILAQYGFKVLEEQPEPETAPTEVVVEELVFIDGKWVKVKTKRPATPEEADSKTQAEAARVNKQIADIIAASNWTQLLDTDGQVQKAWATYRGLIRAIPAQQGFPWTITWPAQP
jgi:hypothetical protein